MIRRIAFALCINLWSFASTLALAADANQAGKVYRIAVLANIPTTTPDRVATWNAFQQTLEQRGFVEGKNVIFERRFAEGRTESFPALAVELAALRPDVIVV